MKADLYLQGHFRETIYLPAGTYPARVTQHIFTHIGDHLDELQKPPPQRLPFFLTPHAKGAPCHES